MDALNAIDEDDVDVSSEHENVRPLSDMDTNDKSSTTSLDVEETVIVQVPKEMDDDDDDDDEYLISMNSSNAHPVEEACDFDDEDMAELDDLEQFLKNAHS
jgi:hypothetical protein